jgi:hypothetical protein
MLLPGNMVVRESGGAGSCGWGMGCPCSRQDGCDLAARFNIGETSRRTELQNRHFKLQI